MKPTTKKKNESEVKEHTKTYEKEPQPTQKALIITNNQSGGSNNVNVQQIPEASIKLNNTEVINQQVKEVETNNPSEKKIHLPAKNYNYDSLYKTVFTIDYHCPINLNAIGFRIKREDIASYFVRHGGKMMSQFATYQQTKQPVFIISQPENGYYTFTIYTVNKFGNPLQEIQYLKD